MPNINLVKYTSGSRDERYSTTPGITIPEGVPIFSGGNAAWDHYCKTLAFHQLSNASLEWSEEYHKILKYFRSTSQKMNLMRLLYLQAEVNFDYTPIQLGKKLNCTRQFIYQTVRECEAEGWVIMQDGVVHPDELLLNAWRHYAMNWWKSNEENKLAGAFYRILHARDSVSINDKIKDF